MSRNKHKFNLKLDTVKITKDDGTTIQWIDLINPKDRKNANPDDIKTAEPYDRDKQQAPD